MSKFFVFLCLFSFFISFNACQGGFFVFEGFQGRKTKIPTSCIAWTNNCFLHCRIVGEATCLYRYSRGITCTTDTAKDPYCVDDNPHYLEQCRDIKKAEKRCNDIYIP